MQLDNVLVVGLGGLGLPVAKYVKEKGFGYDANIEAIDKVE
jgi:molybdopterin/thiamine biosynthesis adenylyltransferase